MTPYRPLANPETDIRLLTILPSSSEEDDIRVTLQHTPLEDATAYEALSYTWRISEKWDFEYPIYVDNVEVIVLENLYFALRALRQPTSPRVIWNDRICIDQADDGDHGEKMKQIGLMRDIYGKAEKVIAWLGHRSNEDLQFYSGPATEPAASLVTKRDVVSLFYVVTTVLNSVVEGKIWPVAHHPETQWSVRMRERVPWVDQWSFHQFTEPLLDLMADPYWQRIWVVQELTVAKKIEVQIRRDTFDWGLLKGAAKTVSHHFQSCCQNRKGHTDETTAAVDESFALFSRTIMEIETTRKLYEEGTKLEPLLRRHRNKAASKRVDIMNALVNLVRDWGSGPRLVMSSTNVEFEDVVCKALVSQIKAFSSLSVLCGDVGIGDRDHDDVIGGAFDDDAIDRIRDLQQRRMESGDKEEKRAVYLEELSIIKAARAEGSKNMYARASLPSWAKCFACCGTIDNNGPVYTSPRFEHLGLYQAAGSSKPQIQLQMDRTLQIDGEHIDTVSFVADSVLTNRPGDVIKTVFGQQIGDSQQMVLDEWSGKIERFVTLPKLHPTPQKFRVAYLRALQCDVAFPTYRSDGGMTDDARRLTGEEIREFDLHGSDLRGASHNAFALGRKLFITDTGRIGLGSPAIREGDVVVILYGGSVPFILRQSVGTGERDEQRYQLFGDCYCDGLMDGEGTCGSSQTFVLE